MLKSIITLIKHLLEWFISNLRQEKEGRISEHKEESIEIIQSEKKKVKRRRKKELKRHMRHHKAYEHTLDENLRGRGQRKGEKRIFVTMLPRNLADMNTQSQKPNELYT